MKKIAYLMMAMALLVGAQSCGKSGDNGVDVATQAEIDAKIANLKTAADEGADFIAQQLKADKDLKKTASGLVYKLIEPGTGENFKETDKVKVIYTGKHVNGEEFDSSKGEAVEFPVNAVVPGFKETLMLMKPGAKAYCIIPGNLGYGERGAGGGKIAPNETLVFEIETVGLAQ